MSLVIIELNDSEIRAAAGTEILLRQPGYAVIRPDRIETGVEAQNNARRNPRETSNRYWSQLNQDSLSISSPLARHNADLAYAQLLALHEEAGQPEEVLFTVPGSYTREQLSLLLGIVEACPFAAAGLVDAAIAGAAAMAGRGGYNHIDLHLHYAVVTVLEVDGEVVRKSVKVVNNNGLSDIYDTCADLIAGVFIDQSRFDPLHHAETEQNLYGQIPAALAALRDSELTDLEIQYRDKRYQARIFRNSLLQRLKNHYEKIYRELAGAPVSLITDRLQALPGFVDPLKQWIPVDETAVFAGIGRNMEVIRSSGPGLSFITSLPASASPDAAAAAYMPPAEAAPATAAIPAPATHLLVAARAYPLNDRPLYLNKNGDLAGEPAADTPCFVALDRGQARVEVPDGQIIYLNGSRIAGAARAAAGDIISFAGSDTTARFIEVTGH